MPSRLLKNPLIRAILIFLLAALAYRLVIFFDNGEKKILTWEKAKSEYKLERTNPPLKVLRTKAEPINKISDDIDNNGKKENYILENGKMKIFEEEAFIWESPADWRIEDFFISDSIGNKMKYLNLSVWKPGNFGSSKPFWISQNDWSVKNHFFVYALKDEKLKPVWQSSNLVRPNCELIFSDSDADSAQELIVIEGEYEMGGGCHGQYLAVWRWDSWGFTNIWRSGPGEYANLREEDINGKKLITVGEF